MTIGDLKEKLTASMKITIYDYRINQDEVILFDGIACEIPNSLLSHKIKDGCITSRTDTGIRICVVSEDVVRFWKEMRKKENS